jgi:hypothetical protein
MIKVCGVDPKEEINNDKVSLFMKRADKVINELIISDILLIIENKEYSNF